MIIRHKKTIEYQTSPRDKKDGCSGRNQEKTSKKMQLQQ
jgi:hypothetical protein